MSSLRSHIAVFAINVTMLAVLYWQIEHVDVAREQEKMAEILRLETLELSLDREIFRLSARHLKNYDSIVDLERHRAATLEILQDERHCQGARSGSADLPSFGDRVGGKKRPGNPRPPAITRFAQELGGDLSPAALANERFARRCLVRLGSGVLPEQPVADGLDPRFGPRRRNTRQDRQARQQHGKELRGELLLRCGRRGGLRQPPGARPDHRHRNARDQKAEGAPSSASPSCRSASSSTITTAIFS